VFWYTIKVRREKMVRHLLLRDSQTKIVIEGDIDDHIGRGSPRMVDVKQIMIDMGKITIRS
jgi:hypothetical protein